MFKIFHPREKPVADLRDCLETFYLNESLASIESYIKKNGSASDLKKYHQDLDDDHQDDDHYHPALLYVWLKMKNLLKQDDLKKRLEFEHQNFALALPDYIKRLPTKHPEKLRGLKWAVKKCKQKEHRYRYPCDKIMQYDSNPCLKQLGKNELY